MAENPIVAFTAFGKAVGLAIRYKRHMRRLELAPDLVRLLHPRGRARATPQRVQEVALGLGVEAERTSEFLFVLDLVCTALDQGLGPGGFSLISEESWLKLFVDNQ